MAGLIVPDQGGKIQILAKRDALGAEEERGQPVLRFSTLRERPIDADRGAGGCVKRQPLIPAIDARGAVPSSA